MDEKSIKRCFIMLNKYHEEFKNTGPVPKESNEPIWQAFKKASDSIHEAKQKIIEELENKKIENLKKKEILLEKLTNINDFLEEYLIDENDREDKQGFVFLEELLKNVSLGDKLIALSKSIYMPSPPPSPLPSKEGEQKGQSIAVILFTSGSESLPKAVPLTHKNIIENIR